MYFGRWLEKRVLGKPVLGLKLDKGRFGSSQRIRVRIAEITSPTKPQAVNNRSVEPEKSKKSNFHQLFLFGGSNITGTQKQTESSVEVASNDYKGSLSRTGSADSQPRQHNQSGSTSLIQITEGQKAAHPSDEEFDEQPITNLEEEIAAIKLRALNKNSTVAASGQPGAQIQPRTVATDKNDKKAVIEAELGLRVFEERVKPKHLQRLRWLLQHLSWSIKQVYGSFEANKQAQMLTGCREVARILGQMTIPPKLVETLYGWLLALLREFHELPWTIQVAHDGLVFARLTDNKKMVFRLLLLIGNVIAELRNPVCDKAAQNYISQSEFLNRLLTDTPKTILTPSQVIYELAENVLA